MNSDVVCRPFTFKTVGKSYSSLMNRYKLGRVTNGRLMLDPYECAFLLVTGKIKPEGAKTPSEIIQHFEDSESFSYIFTIYYALKKAGFYARVAGNGIEIRKKPSDLPLLIRPGMEDQGFDVCSQKHDGEEISAVVDMDGDITIFGVSVAEISGEIDISDLDRTTFVEGKRIQPESDSFPEWIGYSRGKMRFLSEVEYAGIEEHPGKNVAGSKGAVYSDLVSRGLILKSGFKYGADFRAYVSPDSEHAEYLINTIEKETEWSRLSRIVRVANAVRKTAILSCAKSAGISYLKIRRIKDFNSLYSDQIWASKSSTVGLNSE